MSARTTSTFTLDRGDAVDLDEVDGVCLGRARVTKTYVGELAATGITELLPCVARDGSAAYGGSERLTGTLAGRRGTFVRKHDGVATRGVQSPAAVLIAPDSGTDEVATLSGSGSVLVDEPGGHQLELGELRVTPRFRSPLDRELTA